MRQTFPLTAWRSRARRPRATCWASTTTGAGWWPPGRSGPGSAARLLLAKVAGQAGGMHLVLDVELIRASA